MRAGSEMATVAGEAVVELLPFVPVRQTTQARTRRLRALTKAAINCRFANGMAVINCRFANGMAVINCQFTTSMIA